MSAGVNDSAAHDPVALAMRAGRDESRVARAVALAELERRMFGGTRPSTIGRYVVGDAIGSGAQGTVWIAHDPELDRDVAIKLIHASGRLDASGRARLRREAQALARIDHPHVIGVLDIGEHEGQLYMVTRLVEGADLRRWLAAEPRSSAQRIAVLHDVAAGLVAVHACGLLHRDLKPANVLVDERGRALLADFGLAQGGEPEAATVVTQDGVADPRHTATGLVVGTPAYLAPEQHGGASASEATDRYAFCVTAWEVLFDALPFVGESVRELAEAKLSGRIAVPKGTDVPPALARALQRGLATDPRQRQTSTTELAAAIDAASRPRRSRRATAAVLGLAALGGVAVAAAQLDAAPATIAGETTSSFTPLMAELALAHGRMRQRVDDKDGALSSFSRAHELALASRRDRVVAEVAIELGRHHVVGRRDLDEAERWTREADAALQRIGGAEQQPGLAAHLHTMKSGLAAARGEWNDAGDEAEQAIALAEGVPGRELALATALEYRALAQWKRGHTEAAIADYERTLAIYRSALGPWHPRTATALGNLAAPMLAEDEHAESAIPLLREAIAIRTKAAGGDDLQTAQHWISLATALRLVGELEAAAQAGERAIAITKARLGPSDARIALALRSLGDVHIDAGQWESAIARHGEAVAQYEAAGRAPEDLAWALHKLGLAQRMHGALAAARRSHVRALELREQSDDAAYSHLALAEVEAALGDAAAARAQLARGRALATDDAELVGLACWVAARVELALGDEAQARTLLRQAIAELEAAGVPSSAAEAGLELARLEQGAGEVAASERASAGEHARAPSVRAAHSRLVVLGLAGARATPPDAPTHAAATRE